MIRVTKLADYGILLMTWFAHRDNILRERGETPGRMTAGELAAATGLPLPTVSKLLGLLVKGQVLTSHRGVNGGYALAGRPDRISVADIIAALEGPIALTDCLSDTTPTCEVESLCPTRTNWGRINEAIRTALEAITLDEMARPQTGWRRRMSDSLTATSQEAS